MNEKRLSHKELIKQARRLSLQKNISIGKAVSGVLLLIAAGFTAYIYYLITDHYTDSLATAFGFGIAAVLFTIVLLIYYLHKQEIADRMYENIVVIWKYNPKELYRFCKYTAFKEKPVKCVQLLIIAAGVFLLTLALMLTEVQFIILLGFTISALLLICAVLAHPYMRYHLLKFKNLFYGAAKDIIISRTGIFAVGRIHKFGYNSAVFLRAEAKALGMYDCIVFYYHQKYGYQTVTREVYIPIPPQASKEEVTELLELFNSPDLYMQQNAEHEK